MALHLLKLAVGIETIAGFEIELERRLAARRAAGQPDEQIHTTRMVPKRVSELLDGGSLYWVVRGQIAARQELVDIRPFTDAEGIGRCHIVMKPMLVAVMPRPCRPFQGWRYLEAERRPADIGGGDGTGEMPEALRYALRELCLL